jgi:hypothetical protein
MYDAETYRSFGEVFQERRNIIPRTSTTPESLDGECGNLAKSPHGLARWLDYLSQYTYKYAHSSKIRNVKDARREHKEDQGIMVYFYGWGSIGHIDLWDKGEIYPEPKGAKETWFFYMNP